MYLNVSLQYLKSVKIEHETYGWQQMLGKLWNQNGSDAVLECREGGYITGLCSEIIQLTTTNSLQLFNQASSATIVFYHDYHHHDQQLYIERSSEPRGKRFNQKTGSKGLWIGTRTVYQGQGNSIVDQHGHQPTPITQNNFLVKREVTRKWGRPEDPGFDFLRLQKTAPTMRRDYWSPPQRKDLSMASLCRERQWKKRCRTSGKRRSREDQRPVRVRVVQLLGEVGRVLQLLIRLLSANGPPLRDWRWLQISLLWRDLVQEACWT